MKKPYSYSYSLKKAKEIVRLYNELHNCAAVAARAKLSASTVRHIVLWLAQYDRCNTPVNDGEDEARLALPTSRVWLEFLYTHNVSPRTAAACVAWPYARVLTTCGGEEEWLKLENRRCVVTATQGDGPAKNDPAPDEIAARAKELFEARERTPNGHGEHVRRVEVAQYNFDGRTNKFDYIG